MVLLAWMRVELPISYQNQKEVLGNKSDDLSAQVNNWEAMMCGFQSFVNSLDRVNSTETYYFGAHYFLCSNVLALLRHLIL